MKNDMDEKMLVLAGQIKEECLAKGVVFLELMVGYSGEALIVVFKTNWPVLNDLSPLTFPIDHLQKEDFAVSFAEVFMGIVSAPEKYAEPIRKLERSEYMDDWSNQACFGYMILAAEENGLTEKQINDLIRSMKYFHDTVSVEEAKKVYCKS